MPKMAPGLFVVGVGCGMGWNAVSICGLHRLSVEPVQPVDGHRKHHHCNHVIHNHKSYRPNLRVDSLLWLRGWLRNPHGCWGSAEIALPRVGTDDRLEIHAHPCTSAPVLRYHFNLRCLAQRPLGRLAQW